MEKKKGWPYVDGGALAWALMRKGLLVLTLVALRAWPFLRWALDVLTFTDFLGCFVFFPMGVSPPSEVDGSPGGMGDRQGR